MSTSAKSEARVRGLPGLMRGAPGGSGHRALSGGLQDAHFPSIYVPRPGSTGVLMIEERALPKVSDSLTKNLTWARKRRSAPGQTRAHGTSG